MADCEVYRSAKIDGAYVTLACWLPEDHDGPHYDEADDLTWQIGRPAPFALDDDPPEYDPYDAAADQAEDHAAAQAEPSRIEAEEARGGA